MTHTHTDIETQRHRDTEAYRHRDTETQRHTDTDTDTHTHTHTHTHADTQTHTHSLTHKTHFVQHVVHKIDGLRATIVTGTHTHTQTHTHTHTRTRTHVAVLGCVALQLRCCVRGDGQHVVAADRAVHFKAKDSGVTLFPIGSAAGLL